jgi:hypothetical protein
MNIYVYIIWVSIGDINQMILDVSENSIYESSYTLLAVWLYGNIESFQWLSWWCTDMSKTLMGMGQNCWLVARL